jgi:hypothetical protein
VRPYVKLVILNSCDGYGMVPYGMTSHQVPCSCFHDYRTYRWGPERQICYKFDSKVFAISHLTIFSTAMRRTHGQLFHRGIIKSSWFRAVVHSWDSIQQMSRVSAAIINKQPCVVTWRVNCGQEPRDVRLAKLRPAGSILACPFMVVINSNIILSPSCERVIAFRNAALVPQAAR